MKNILIIGASTGIGYGLVTKFLSHGYNVFTVSRNINTLNELLIQNKKITIIQADITNADHREIIVSKLPTIGPLEIINNAAIGIPQIFRNLGTSELRGHFETNFFAPVIMFQKILSKFNVTRVLNITSGAAEFPVESLFSYCTSKAAIGHAIKCLNLEYPSTKFSNLRPGMVDTELQERWRNVDDSLFPNGNAYVQAKKDGKLISVETVTDFIYWVMTNSAEYKEMWNIHDIEHHKHWLKSEKLLG